MNLENSQQYEARTMPDSMMQSTGSGFHKETDRAWRHRMLMEHNNKMDSDPEYAEQHRQYMKQLKHDRTELNNY